MSVAGMSEYNGIIPTGWLTAYGRSFSDILYAQSVFEELEAIKLANGPSPILEEMMDTKLAPQFEARYKLLDRLIAQSNIKQVLEIAAGISTRGIVMTEDPSVKYVEVDLPDMNTDKRAIMNRLLEKKVVPKRSNLYIQEGSATNIETLLAACHHFDDQNPLVVVNEGLMRYLSFDDKATYIDNVKILLGKFGGTWITSDISLPKVKRIEDGMMGKRREWISDITGRDVTKNFFKDVDDAKNFFERRGLLVESHSFLEVVDELVSPEKLGMPKDQVVELTSSAVVFVMQLTKQ